MNHRRPPLPAIVIILLLIAVTVYFIITQSTAEENRALTASGNSESVTVNIAPEMAGKVMEVLVKEGQPVQKGDPLLRLDNSLLQSEKQAAQSVMGSANAAVKSAEVALESTKRLMAPFIDQVIEPEDAIVEEWHSIAGKEIWIFRSEEYYLGAVSNMPGVHTH